MHPCRFCEQPTSDIYCPHCDTAACVACLSRWADGSGFPLVACRCPLAECGVIVRLGELNICVGSGRRPSIGVLWTGQNPDVIEL